MKVCVLFGSPHPEGHTTHLLNDYLSGFPEAEIRRFDAYDTPVHPCVGCGGCKQDGRCVYRDMDDLYRAVEESDLLIVATPVYYLSMPAPLKAVIDRFQPYFERRFTLGQQPPIQKPRKAAFLLCYGSDKYGGAEPLATALTMLSTVLNVTEIKCITKKDCVN